MDFLILLSLTLRSRVAAETGGLVFIAVPEITPGALVLRSWEGISGSVVSSVILTTHDIYWRKK
jgi:hypothetical protein